MGCGTIVSLVSHACLGVLHSARVPAHSLTSLWRCLHSEEGGSGQGIANGVCVLLVLCEDTDGSLHVVPHEGGAGCCTTSSIGGNLRWSCTYCSRYVVAESKRVMCWPMGHWSSAVSTHGHTQSRMRVRQSHVGPSSRAGCMHSLLCCVLMATASASKKKRHSWPACSMRHGMMSRHRPTALAYAMPYLGMQ